MLKWTITIIVEQLSNVCLGRPRGGKMCKKTVIKMFTRTRAGLHTVSSNFHLGWTSWCEAVQKQRFSHKMRRVPSNGSSVGPAGSTISVFQTDICSFPCFDSHVRKLKKRPLFLSTPVLDCLSYSRTRSYSRSTQSTPCWELSGWPETFLSLKQSTVESFHNVAEVFKK